MRSYKDVYYDLLKEKKDLQKKEKSFSLPLKNRFSLICQNIANIEKPLTDDFLSKVLFIKKSGVHLNELSFTSDFQFPDRTSVYLWYSSLVDYYLSNKMTEEEEVIFLDMFQVSLGKNDFQSAVLYLQMVLKMLDKESFCAFLDIKPYLYIKFYNLKCGQKVILSIIHYLSCKNLSFLTNLQKKEVESFLTLLKEKGKELPELDKNKGVKKSLGAQISKETFQGKITEILQYIQNNRVSSISNDVLFSDGKNMLNWYDLYLRYDCFDYTNLELLEIKRRGAYQIAKELYNPSTVPLHEEISVDYGSSLRKVMAIYCLNLEGLSSLFKVPARFLLQIMENKLVPTEDFIDCVLAFLKDLPICDDYQKEFLEEAISVYEHLKSLHLEGDKLSFIIYPATKEEEYLTLWNDFDSSILEKVKKTNYDWYLKCLTIYYIFNKRNGTITKDDFFYDGSIANKWMTTQRRAAMGKIKSLSKEQSLMMDRIDTLLSNIEYNFMCKNDEKTILLNSFDQVCQAFDANIQQNGDISLDSYYENVPLRNLWNYIYKKLAKKETPFSHEQILKFKELRRKVLFNQKKKNKSQGKKNFNFDYELTCFMDSFHISLSQASLLLGVSFEALAYYSRGENCPRMDSIDKMLFSLQQLDLSSFREDQIEDVKNFIQVLLLFKNKSYIEERNFSVTELLPYMDFSLITGNLSEDVPVSLLQEVKNTDLSWYQEFQKLYLSICQGVQYEENFLELEKRKWFIVETDKVYQEKSTPTKKELLRYLYYFYKKKRKSMRFVRRFEIVEDFIYTHKRLPDEGELPLFEEQDGRKFYCQMRDSLYGLKDYYRDLPDDLLEQMTILEQYVVHSRRESLGYKKDAIKGNKYFLGERISNLRVCLGFSRDAFPRRLGWDKKETFLIYSNRNALTEQHLQDLLRLLKDMEKESLREYQIKEIQDFLLVLATKKLDDDFYLRFCPKK